MDLDYWIPSVCHFTQLWISRKRPDQQTTFWLHNFDWLLYLSHFLITASVWKHAKDEVDSIAKHQRPSRHFPACKPFEAPIPSIGLSTCWSTNKCVSLNINIEPQQSDTAYPPLIIQHVIKLFLIPYTIYFFFNSFNNFYPLFSYNCFFSHVFLGGLGNTLSCIPILSPIPHPLFPPLFHPWPEGRLDDDRHDRRPRGGRVAAGKEWLDRGGVQGYLCSILAKTQLRLLGNP